MMKKLFLLLIALCVFMFAASQSAFADSICREGTELRINPVTQEEFCVITSDELMPNYDHVTSRGIFISTGLAYTGILAINVPLLIGFDFGTFNENKTLGFALMADVNFSFGFFPLANFNATFVPTFYTTYHSFRLSLGLGVGMNSWLAHFTWSSDGDDDSRVYDRKEVNFLLAPSISFDWFVDEHLWLGFGAKVQIIFYENSNFYRGYEYTSTLPLPVLDLIHVGYKFTM